MLRDSSALAFWTEALDTPPHVARPTSLRFILRLLLSKALSVDISFSPGCGVGVVRCEIPRKRAFREDERSWESFVDLGLF